jgi:hypothetical protein
MAWPGRRKNAYLEISDAALTDVVDIVVSYAFILRDEQLRPPKPPKLRARAHDPGSLASGVFGGAGMRKEEHHIKETEGVEEERKPEAEEGGKSEGKSGDDVRDDSGDEANDDDGGGD